MEDKILCWGSFIATIIIIIMTVYFVYLSFDIYEPFKSSDYCPFDIITKSGSNMIRNPVLRQGRKLIRGEKTSVEKKVDPLKDKISTEDKKNLDRKKDELQILKFFKNTMY